jgi:hypothetical protein
MDKLTFGKARNTDMNKKIRKVGIPYGQQQYCHDDTFICYDYKHIALCWFFVF